MLMLHGYIRSQTEHTRVCYLICVLYVTLRACLSWGLDLEALVLNALVVCVGLGTSVHLISKEYRI